MNTQAETSGRDWNTDLGCRKRNPGYESDGHRTDAVRMSERNSQQDEGAGNKRELSRALTGTAVRHREGAA